MSAFDAPVVIAGAGPVGVTLASDLARLGVASIVLERRRGVPPNPRCNTTNARSMELFRRLGCADAVRSAGLPADHCTDVVYMTKLNGHELTRYRRSTPAEVRAGHQHDVAANWPTPEPQHFLSQIYLEPILRQHAVDHFGVDLREGWQVVSFEQDETGVTTIARDVDSGDERRLRSAYLVGADGSASRIRHAIGARLQGMPGRGAVCSTFFRSARVTELAQTTPGWMFRFLGGAMLIAIDGAERWLMHNGVPPSEDAETYDPEGAMFFAVGEPFDYEIIDRALWRSRAMVATKFREGRVFVAGDAAHIWIPMGGFGMNAGIADAISLSWRLAGVVDGWADERLLDTYEIERTPIGSRVAGQALRWAMGLGPLMRHTPDRLAELDGSEAARRELGGQVRATNLGEFECPGFQLGTYYADSPVICHDDTPPPPLSVEEYVETSWPGARLPHIWRADGTSLFDQLGAGFTLLRVGDRPPTGDALGADAEARCVPFRVVDVADAEVGDRYQGYRLVLVRPDQHIAWRSMTEPDSVTAARVLDRVTGRLVPARVVRDLSATRLVAGFELPGGLAWWKDNLVVADTTGRAVRVLDPVTGMTERTVDVEQQPGGVGVLPDGGLVISSRFDRKLYVMSAGGLEQYADLSDLAAAYVGALVVDSVGRIYVADGGRVLLVEQPNRREVVLEDLDVPVGLALSADGQMLLVAESGGAGIGQCRVNDDGSLRPSRPFVAEPACGGVARDGDGGLWACDREGGRAVRYDAAGRPTHSVAVPDGRPLACALDPDERRLYLAGTGGVWVADLEVPDTRHA